MIKRRFYRQDRGDKDDGSDSDSSSSSSSDSDVSDASEQPVKEAEEEVQQDDELSDRVNLQMPSSSSSSSGYESDCTSADEHDVESPGKIEKAAILETLAKDVSLPNDVGKWILKSKSVFKCRLCPKIVCLNEESLKTHLKSKRHARSEKLQSNGRLKHMLNSDGEEEEAEEDGETHAERHARILALARTQEEPKKKSRGRQRQRLRMKRKKEINEASTKETSQKVKKQRKNV